MTHKALQWLRWRGILALAALTPPCRKITELASRRMEEPWSPWTGFRVRMHLRICRACERYLQQLEVLRSAAKESLNEKIPPAGPGLADDAKARLRERLRCERAG